MKSNFLFLSWMETKERKLKKTIVLLNWKSSWRPSRLRKTAVN